LRAESAVEKIVGWSATREIAVSLRYDKQDRGSCEALSASLIGIGIGHWGAGVAWAAGCNH